MEALAGVSLLGVSLALAGLLIVDGIVLVGVLLPGDLIVVTSTGTVGLPGVLVVGVAGVAGLVAGHVASFWVGRWYGPHLWTSRLGRKVGFERWCRAEQIFREGGDRTVLVIPFLPVVNTVLPALAGALGIPPRRYLLLIALADLAWVGLWSTVGIASGLLASALGAADLALLVSGVVAGAALIVTTLVLRHAHRRAAPLRCALPGDPAPDEVDPGRLDLVLSGTGKPTPGAVAGHTRTARRISAQHRHGSRHRTAEAGTPSIEIDDTHDGVRVVHLSGDLTIGRSPDLDVQMDAVLDELATAPATVEPHLVVDLGGVRFLSYHGLVTLLGLRHRAGRRGVTVHLVGRGNALVRRALRLTGTDDHLSAHHHPHEVIAGLRRTREPQPHRQPPPGPAQDEDAPAGDQQESR